MYFHLIAYIYSIYNNSLNSFILTTINVFLGFAQRINLTSLSIGLTVFNVIFTWLIFSYLRTTRRQLFLQQFARKKEITEHNQVIQITRWHRFYRKLDSQRILKNKCEAIKIYLVEVRILGQRTHFQRQRNKRWFF